MEQAEVTDAQKAVKDALRVWTDFMSESISDSMKLGYGSPVGFNTKSVSGWDDFEYRVEKNLAINVQGIISGLPNLQQCAIDHFHLGAVWSSNRGADLEAEYNKALLAIEIALRRRGLL
jgi:hypothetical protein